MTNRTFIRLMLTVPVLFGLLCGLWAASASAADSPRCERHEVLVTAKDGSQHISDHTVCEVGK